jgi:hypothetical protein
MSLITSWGRSRKRLRRAQVVRYKLSLEQLETREVPSNVTHNFSGIQDQVISALNDGSYGSNKTAKGLLGTTSSTAANVNTDSFDTTHDETTIAVNPTDPLNMIGSANDYQRNVTGGGKIQETTLSRARVTFDGGVTWSTYALPANAYGATGDPGMAFDATGRAYFSSLGFLFAAGGKTGVNPDVTVSTSTDGGQSWSHLAVVAHGTGSFFSPGVSNDKPYIAAWGNGNAIVTYTQFIQGNKGSYLSSPIFATVTHDGGQTWSAPTQISGNLISDQFSTPVVAADGSIYVSFVSSDADVGPDFRDSYMVVKVDPNTGRAIGSPVDVGLVYDGAHDYPINADGAQTYQDSEFRANPSGSITTDPTNAKHVAVIWSDMRNSTLLTSSDPYSAVTNSDVIVSQSFDGGQTWSAPKALAEPNDQFMPWGVYNAAGLLQIGYFDRSYDSANHKYGYTLASETTPGSLSFTTTQLTPVLSDPTQNNAWFGTTVDSSFPQATLFMGDYSNIAVTPTGVAALWTDLRLPANFPGHTGATQDAFFASAAFAVPLAPGIQGANDISGSQGGSGFDGSPFSTDSAPDGLTLLMGSKHKGLDLTTLGGP